MRELTLPSTLMHPQAKTCRDAWTAQLRAVSAPVAWQVDASALSQFDSSALAVLLACRREALALGHTFGVRQMPAKLQALAALYGVLTLLEGPMAGARPPRTHP